MQDVRITLSGNRATDAARGNARAGLAEIGDLVLIGRFSFGFGVTRSPAHGSVGAPRAAAPRVSVASELHRAASHTERRRGCVAGSTDRGEDSFGAENLVKSVYVRLLGEGTFVFRPAPAEFLEPDKARLMAPPGYDPEDEDWEFKPGSIVRVELRQLGGVDAFVAVARAE